ncbi:centrosomal protein of 95 kDa [Chanos chanos]|uniref:Centrosomal protein of 95 kDa n=1 Tax=Chanos chanos TaxID=29144 RepID=A0A6J2VYK2_CHACN|nr:centrosomal protein of 95 kDa [Chanos chanos]
MGTEEKDWVDVANELLCKCHINLRLHRLSDCDSNVFVALYEAILGEKVPDYIVAPRSQEDDIHNVQSVIDSLALDYLQISLSHITGENIVRGDKDSIKNLLEIFDGLLEYLTEQISEEEELQNGGTDCIIDKRDRVSRASSVQSVVHSSKHSLHSWNGDESESTTELIRLGDSAHTFSAKNEVHSSILPTADNLSISLEPDSSQDAAGPRATLLRQPLRSAIPLQPPYQTTPQRPERPRPAAGPASDTRTSPKDGETPQEPPAARLESPGPVSDGCQPNGRQSPSTPRSAAESERSVSCQRKDKSGESNDQTEATGVGPRRVLFRTQPDVLLLSLRNELEGTELLNGHVEEDDDEEDEDEGLSSCSSSERQRNYRIHGRQRVSGSRLEEGEESLTRRSRRNRKAEQELHDMSEKLSRRLEELDQMLKRALGETGETTESKEEDKRSHHSDSVMECRRPGRSTDETGVLRPPRTRSLSPSPPPPISRSLPAQLEDTLIADSRRDPARTQRKEIRDLQGQRRRAQMVASAYEDELKRLEEEERAQMASERVRVQDMEREYREAVLKDPPRVSKPAQIYSSKITAPHRSPRSRRPRKTTPLKVKENDLLPVVLEELPHLHLSPHTLNRMWKQQMKQVDRLNAPENQRRRNKLTNQVEEAQKRHDLLVEIIRKEQEHNRRLKDYRERVQQQKSAQNKLREQRQQIARAKKYYSDYHVQHRARLMRARTREERMFKQVFEEGLELQKARLREQRAYAKEQREEHQRRHRDEIQAMENYYKDQFSLLAETLAQEREEIQLRKKAQEKALQKMKRELRNKMEREIMELQKIIIQNDEDDYFRDLEVERLRKRVQMASFQYNTSCLQ